MPSNVCLSVILSSLSGSIARNIGLSLVFTFVGSTLLGDSIKTVPPSDSAQTVELFFESDEFDAEKNYCLFVSSDLNFWTRTIADVTVSENGASVIAEVSPIEDKLFFKVEEYEYIELNPDQVEEQLTRLENLLDSYCLVVKAKLADRPEIEELGKETVDLLALLTKDIVANLDGVEKTRFIEVLFNSGFLDEMDSAVVEFSPAGSFGTTLLPQMQVNFDLEPWTAIKLARGWKNHSKALKRASMIESIGALIAGPQSMLAIGAIGLISTIGDLSSDLVPTCPADLWIYSDLPTNNLYPGQEPYPEIVFSADFVSESTLTVEAIAWGVNELIGKLIGLAYKSYPTDKLGLDPLSAYIDEVAGATDEWLVKQAYSKIVDHLKALVLQHNQDESDRWNNIVFEPAYWNFGAEEYLTFRLDVDPPNVGAQPVIYDFQSNVIEPRKSGSGRIRFFLDDTLCNEFLTEHISFEVESKLPTIGDPSIAYLNPENDALLIEISIEDEDSENLIIGAESDFGDITWVNGVLRYIPKEIILEVPTVLYVNQFAALSETVSASFGDSTSDIIHLSVSDGQNDPVTLDIPIDLTGLLNEIQINLEERPEGMLAVFEKVDSPFVNSTEGSLDQMIELQLVNGYSGDGAPFKVTGTLGGRSSSSFSIIIPSLQIAFGSYLITYKTESVVNDSISAVIGDNEFYLSCEGHNLNQVNETVDVVAFIIFDKNSKRLWIDGELTGTYEVETNTFAVSYGQMTDIASDDFATTYQYKGESYSGDLDTVDFLTFSGTLRETYLSWWTIDGQFAICEAVKSFTGIKL